MNDASIARITGAFGLACVALTFGQFPLWLGTPHPCTAALKMWPVPYDEIDVPTRLA